MRTLIDLTHKFDLKTIAEWVETPEDAAILQDANVDLMQGNLFGEVAVGLPWARKEERGFTSLETVDQLPVPMEETKVLFVQNPPVMPPPLVDVSEMPDNAELEEGLSRLKLAIKALDDQFRKSPAFDPEQPLAEAS